MTKFRQKVFTESDAMRALYNELMNRCHGDRRKWPVIEGLSSMLSVLKGNNIVVEKFVLSDSIFGREKYRMYLKIGAKAKLPDEVKLPSTYYDRTLGNMKLTFSGGVFGKDKNFSERIKLFGKGGGGGPKPSITAEASPYVDLKVETSKILGEAIRYDKKDRSLVLEFDSIDDAIKALNILPFGIDYKIYLLNV